MVATNDDGSFAGKVAFVTGSASGIGRAVALAFAAEGASTAPSHRGLDLLAAGHVASNSECASAEPLDHAGRLLVALLCDVGNQDGGNLGYTWPRTDAPEASLPGRSDSEGRSQNGTTNVARARGPAAD